MTTRRLIKLGLSAAALVASSALAVPVAASAAAPTTEVSSSSANAATVGAGVNAREISSAIGSGANGLTSADWRQVERNARNAGDTAGAKAVDRYLDGRTSHRGAETNGIKTKLVKILLRHGGPALAKALKKASPRAAKWIEKNSGKLANWLDEVEGFSELAITTFLSSQGVDPLVAADVARWIVLFAG